MESLIIYGAIESKKHPAPSVSCNTVILIVQSAANALKFTGETYFTG